MYTNISTSSDNLLKANLCGIPNDIWGRIFEYVDFVTYWKSRSICKQMKSILMGPNLLKRCINAPSNEKERLKLIRTFYTYKSTFVETLSTIISPIKERSPHEDIGLAIEIMNKNNLVNSLKNHINTLEAQSITNKQTKVELIILFNHKNSHIRKIVESSLRRSCLKFLKRELDRVPWGGALVSICRLAKSVIERHIELTIYVGIMLGNFFPLGLLALSERTKPILPFTESLELLLSLFPGTDNFTWIIMVYNSMIFTHVAILLQLLSGTYFFIESIHVTKKYNLMQKNTFIKHSCINILVGLVVWMSWTIAINTLQGALNTFK